MTSLHSKKAFCELELHVPTWISCHIGARKYEQGRPLFKSDLAGSSFLAPVRYQDNSITHRMVFFCEVFKSGCMVV